MPECPICFYDAQCAPLSDDDRAEWTCVRCGHFSLTGTAETLLPAQFQTDYTRRTLLSHLIRQMQRANGSPVVISEETLPSFWAQRIPTPEEQADSLIRFIGITNRARSRPSKHRHRLGAHGSEPAYRGKATQRRSMVLFGWIGRRERRSPRRTSYTISGLRPASCSWT
jgi:hypothetical protein